MVKRWLTDFATQSYSQHLRDVVRQRRPTVCWPMVSASNLIKLAVVREACLYILTPPKAWEQQQTPWSALRYIAVHDLAGGRVRVQQVPGSVQTKDHFSRDRKTRFTSDLFHRRRGGSRHAMR